MKSLSLVISLTFVICAQANETLKSRVELEFETETGAKSYQIEIKRAEQVVVLKDAKEPSFVLELEPGKYQIRTRSRDLRGVFGLWSEAQEVVIDAPGLNLTQEHSRQKILNAEKMDDPVVLDWPTMPMAVGYKVVIKNSKGDVVLEKSVAQNSLSVALVPGKYQFNVWVEYSQQLFSPASTFEPTILVQGNQVPAPKLQWSKDKAGKRILSWKVPLGVSSQARLEYRSFLSTDWKLVTDQIEKNEIHPHQLRPPGMYRLVIHSKAEGFESSPAQVEEFEVKPSEDELHF